MCFCVFEMNSKKNVVFPTKHPLIDENSGGII